MQKSHNTSKVIVVRVHGESRAQTQKPHQDHLMGFRL